MALKIGKVLIVKVKPGVLWLRHDDGEGMEVREDALRELIEKYFWEAF